MNRRKPKLPRNPVVRQGGALLRRSGPHERSGADARRAERRRVRLALRQGDDR